MTFDMFIVLGALALMIGLMVANKYPMGMVTLFICLLLGLFGILSPSEVLSGFTQPTVVLIAGITGVIGAINKTAMIDKFSDVMLGLKPKQEFLVYISYLAAGFVLCQFMASTQAWLILIAFMSTMPAKKGQRFTPTRILLPMLCMMETCKTKIPISSGAATFANLNVRYQGFFASDVKLIGFWEPLLFSLPLMIVAWIYALTAWRLMPQGGELTMNGNSQARTRSTYTQRQNVFIYICFIVSIAALMLNNKIGDIYYLVPLAATFAIAFSKVMKPREVLLNAAGNQVLACAGLLTIANTVSNCGLGDVLGSALQGFYGTMPSPFFVYITFAFFCAIITQFMSNAGTQSLMIPVAAMLCAAAGWDPRGLVLLISVAAQQSMLLPGGSTECALVYAADGYNPLKTLRYTLPFLILDTLVVTFTAYVCYPLY